jgi:prepilin-type N-terminal cleavage/methylation domain-containing protein
MIPKTPQRRRGFTIIELLVAMALIILIMAVLSEAFVAGLSAFTSLKAIGDMQQRMRVSTTRLRLDLAGYHFEESRRASDLDNYFVDPAIGNGDQASLSVGGRPQQGFFRIQTPPSLANPPGFPPSSLRLEGADSDNIPSWITDPATVIAAIGPGTAPGPILHFTTKLVPDRKDALRRDQVFTTPVPNSLTTPGASLIDTVEGPVDFRQRGLMVSPWAEIAWFLVPTGEFTSGSGTTPIYALYRRQRLLIAGRRDTFYATSPTAPPPGTPPGGGMPWTALGGYYGVSVEPDPSQPLLLWNSEYSVAEQPYAASTGAGRAVARSMNYQPQNPPGMPSVLQVPYQWVSAPVRVGEQVNNGFPVLPVPVAPESAALLGDDLVTTDVISFEIKVLRPGDADFRDLNDLNFPGAGGVSPYTDPITGTPGTYDTATTRPGFLSLRAIKVTIRVWDFKTQQARQISVIQDL